MEKKLLQEASQKVPWFVLAHPIWNQTHLLKMLSESGTQLQRVLESQTRYILQKRNQEVLPDFTNLICFAYFMFLSHIFLIDKRLPLRE